MFMTGTWINQRKIERENLEMIFTKEVNFSWQWKKYFKLIKIRKYCPYIYIKTLNFCLKEIRFWWDKIFYFNKWYIKQKQKFYANKICLKLVLKEVDWIFTLKQHNMPDVLSLMIIKKKKKNWCEPSFSDLTLLFILLLLLILQVLATGLSGLYSLLPRKLPCVSEDWHQFTQEDIAETAELSMFLNSLEFCNAVIQVMFENFYYWKSIFV